MVGHVAPEAAVGGPLAGLREGDRVRIDVGTRTIEAEGVDFTSRLTSWKPPEPHYRGGVFARYAAAVGSASTGAALRPW